MPTTGTPLHTIAESPRERELRASLQRSPVDIDGVSRALHFSQTVTDELHGGPAGDASAAPPPMGGDRLPRTPPVRPCSALARATCKALLLPDSCVMWSVETCVRGLRFRRH
jgi:hypothetical protein